MELRHLRYFVALADCLNFTRAAERVHVTQSTLSHQIRQLEDELGSALFERIGKKVVMTEAGEAACEHVARACSRSTRGWGAEGAPQDSPARCASARRTASTSADPAVRRAVPRAASDGQGQRGGAVGRRHRRRLNSGELDLGVAYRPADASELWFEPLYNEEMVLVVSKEHPLAKRKRIRMVELHRPAPGDAAGRVLHPHDARRMLRAAGAEPVIVAEMDTIAPMLGLMAEHTDIGAIVASNAVPAGRGLSIVPLESPTPIRTPGILWKRDVRQTVQMRSFSSIIRKLALSSSLRGKLQGKGS